MRIYWGIVKHVGDWSCRCVHGALGVGGVNCQPLCPPTGTCTYMYTHLLAYVGLTWRGEAYTNDHGNFKINFQASIFENIFNDYFLRLMFVYTTSNVYLTLISNFEIYILNFRKLHTVMLYYECIYKQCCADQINLLYELYDSIIKYSLLIVICNIQNIFFNW